MKYFFGILLITGMIVAGPTVNAQTTKLGHVNITSLLTVMPEYKGAEKKLQEFGKQLSDAYTSMEKEYQRKVAEYYEQEANMLPAIKETKQNEIIDLEKRMQKLEQSSESQLMEKQVELLSPIESKVLTTIKTLAEEKGYTYVFDSSKGTGLLYYQDASDLTAEIKKRLGIQ